MCRLATFGYRQIKRVVIAVIGGTVVLIGIAMIVLPGPAIVVIPLGLAILATEFVWAKWLLNEAKRRAMTARDRFRRGRESFTTESDGGEAMRR